MNAKFLEALELEWDAPSAGPELPAFGRAVRAAARQMKGCYSRYIRNYDEAAARLDALREANGPQQHCRHGWARTHWLAGERHGQVIRAASSVRQTLKCAARIPTPRGKTCARS